MPSVEKSGYCKNCDKDVLIRKKGVSHLVHFILTIFTVGTWLLIWIPSMFLGGMTSYRCSVCGRTVSAKMFR